MVPAEDREPPETAAEAAAVQSDRERVERGGGERGRKGTPRGADFLGRLGPEARAEADPHRPQTQRYKHSRPDESERESDSIVLLE